MSEDLLPFYNAELRALRELADDFAQAHPKIAGRLRLAGEMTEDPFVGRLLEGVALLNARIRKRLDDDFPELSEAMLRVLLPGSLSPLPALGVMALEPDPTITSRYRLEAGAAVETEAIQGHTCQFRSLYPVDLWPIRLKAARLTGQPFAAPANPNAGAAIAVLRLSLETIGSGQSFDQLDLDCLRFFLKADSRKAQQLHELILNGCISVAVADSPNDPDATILPALSIRPVGFAPEEMATPTPPGGSLGPALLMEYFAFPEKFLFFEVNGLASRLLRGVGPTLELFFYLNCLDSELERSVSADDFELFATPIINLFEQVCEPIRLDLRRAEHRIIPDARRERAIEVHSLTDVELIGSDGKTEQCLPLFAPRPLDADGAHRAYQESRRPSGFRAGGLDVYLSIVNRMGTPSFNSEEVINCKALCFNRDLPALLPFGGGHPALTLLDSGKAIRRVRAITPFSSPLRAPGGGEANWRLISLLNLNHQSFSDEAVAQTALRDVLAVFDLRESSVTRAARNRLLSVTSRTTSGRAPHAGAVVFCTGTEIDLEFDDSRLSGSGSYLLGCVLEQFFAGQTTLNSFTRTRLRLKGDLGVWASWPARGGRRRLV
jgi:type VI secretion system protein ImpG